MCAPEQGVTALSLLAGQKLGLDFIYCEIPLEVERAREFLVFCWNSFSVWSGENTAWGLDTSYQNRVSLNLKTLWETISGKVQGPVRCPRPGILTGSTAG